MPLTDIYYIGKQMNRQYSQKVPKFRKRFLWKMNKKEQNASLEKRKIVGNCLEKCVKIITRYLLTQTS